MDKTEHYELHKEVYHDRPMSLTYTHKNPLISWVENSRIRIIKNIINKLYKKINQDPSKISILDVGCEECYLFDNLNQQFDFTGVDVLEEPLEKARKKHSNYKLIKADAEELPFEDKKFNFVVCSETLEHVRDTDKVLNELKRVAKNYIIISVPNDSTVVAIKKLFSPFKKVMLSGLKEGKVPEHINEFNAKILKTMLNSKFKKFKIISFPLSIFEFKVIAVVDLENGN